MSGQTEAPATNRRTFLWATAGSLRAAPLAAETGGGVHALTAGLPRNGAYQGVTMWIAAVLVLVFSGCASLSCQQTPITVAKKEERGRLDTIPRGYTAETGGLEEIRRPEIVRDYWVQDAEGTWHRVSVEQYRTAEVGQVLELLPDTVDPRGPRGSELVSMNAVLDALLESLQGLKVTFGDTPESFKRDRVQTGDVRRLHSPVGFASIVVPSFKVHRGAATTAGVGA